MHQDQETRDTPPPAPYNTVVTSGVILALTAAVTLARLHYGGGGDWYNDPEVLPNLAREVTLRTGVQVEGREYVVKPTDPELFSHPWLYLTGHGNVSFTDDEAARLRKYLENGGFLYADDDFGMDESFRKAIAKVLPGEQLVEVPFDDPVYSVHYTLEGPPKIHEHYDGPPKGYGIYLNGRLAVYYTYNSNVSDGWTEKHEDPPQVREKAWKMGVNLVLYPLNY